MRVRIAPRIINGLLTLLILNASLATNVPVSATSYTLASNKHQLGNAPGDQESARTVNDRPLSPRLAALQDRLKSGDRKALDSFWKEISERGAPITEAVPDSERDVLVTILWRAREETRNVFVFQLPGIDKPMARLLDTDLWYKTFRFRKGARFVYRLATNLPDPKEWDGNFGRFTRAIRKDPFNPLQFAQRFNENPYEVEFFSAFELPTAEPQLWSVARPAVPTGRVQREKFTSKLLGNERPVWIYTPHGYAADKKRYALLVLSDGGLYVHSARAATTLDNLIAAGVIPPLVAVMVDNPDRGRELSCSSSYADFLAQEIVPWARANYHVTDRPEQTIIGGVSLGGLAAAFVGLKHPEIFGNVLSQSGSFGWKPNDERDWEWLTRQFAASPRLPLRFSFEAGLLENTSGGPAGRPFGPPLLTANRNLRDALQSKGYSVNYTEFNPNLTGNTTFKLSGHANAQVVALYGSFNNWIQTKNYCARETDGWVCRIDLAPGKYTYKFLVDGVGLNDPASSATEDDGNGHVDSVIVIKPK